MPRAVYSALMGAAAAWIRLLLPMVSKRWFMAVLIWAMVEAGSLPSRANRSVPGGILERSKAPAAAQGRRLGRVGHDLLDAVNHQQAVGHDRVEPVGFGLVKRVEDVNRGVLQGRVLARYWRSPARTDRSGCNPSGRGPYLGSEEDARRFISDWRMAWGMAFSTPPAWIPILTILDM